MKSLNSVRLLGYVGEDPQIVTLNDKTRCANFSLATTDKWKNKATGDMKSSTEWHKVQVFNQALIPVVEQYLKKGMPVYIEGEIKYRKYTNKDNRDVFITEIVLKNFKGELILLGEKEKEEPSSSRDVKSFDVNLNDISDDDIPF